MSWITPEDLFFYDGEELLAAMRECHQRPDREAAHRQADQILLAAVRLACSGEVSNRIGAELINSFNDLERWYG